MLQINLNYFSFLNWGLVVLKQIKRNLVEASSKKKKQMKIHKMVPTTNFINENIFIKIIKLKHFEYWYWIKDYPGY